MVLSITILYRFNDCREVNVFFYSREYKPPPEMVVNGGGEQVVLDANRADG